MLYSMLQNGCDCFRCTSADWSGAMNSAMMSSLGMNFGSPNGRNFMYLIDTIWTVCYSDELKSGLALSWKDSNRLTRSKCALHQKVVVTLSSTLFTLRLHRSC